MAHNLARWTTRIGLGEQIVTTKTLRRRFFSLAGRLTRSARLLTLHLPERWPWEEKFNRALARLRASPAAVADHLQRTKWRLRTAPGFPSTRMQPRPSRPLALFPPLCCCIVLLRWIRAKMLQPGQRCRLSRRKLRPLLLPLRRRFGVWCDRRGVAILGMGGFFGSYRV